MKIFMFSQVKYASLKKTESYKTSLFPFNWKGNKTYKTKYMNHCHFVVQNYIIL